MISTTMKIKEDTLRTLNRLKWEWQLKSQDEVIKKLIEIASKIKTGYQVK